MISLYQFRANLLALFRIMIATDLEVDVNYKGRAYRLHVEDLGIKVKRRHGGGQRKLEVVVDDVPNEKCSTCGKLMIAGVCMDPDCPSNLGRKLEQRQHHDRHATNRQREAVS